MVMICVQRTSSTHDCLYATEHLAINILSTDQLDVVSRFAGKASDKFAGLAWEPGPFGSPMLAGSSAQVEAEIRERLQASTHTVFICQVVHATASGLRRSSTVPEASSTAEHCRPWLIGEADRRTTQPTS